MRKYPGRPAFITHHGQSVCISTHDTYYFAEHAKLRAAAVAAHPDTWLPNGKHPPKRAWVVHGGAYRRFLATEKAWYAQYGLTPPSRASFDRMDKIWGTRRLRYGTTGRRKDPAKPVCVHGHTDGWYEYSGCGPNGTWTIRRCKTCQKASQKAKRDARRAEREAVCYPPADGAAAPLCEAGG